MSQGPAGIQRSCKGNQDRPRPLLGYRVDQKQDPITTATQEQSAHRTKFTNTRQGNSSRDNVQSSKKLGNRTRFSTIRKLSDCHHSVIRHSHKVAGTNMEAIFKPPVQHIGFTHLVASVLPTASSGNSASWEKRRTPQADTLPADQWWLLMATLDNILLIYSTEKKKKIK